MANFPETTLSVNINIFLLVCTYIFRASLCNLEILTNLVKSVHQEKSSRRWSAMHNQTRYLCPRENLQCIYSKKKYTYSTPEQTKCNGGKRGGNKNNALNVIELFMLNGNHCRDAVQCNQCLFFFFFEKVKCTLQLKHVEEMLFLIKENGEGLSFAVFN